VIAARLVFKAYVTLLAVVHAVQRPFFPTDKEKLAYKRVSQVQSHGCGNERHFGYILEKH
jgi:hypothetical protein